MTSSDVKELVERLETMARATARDDFEALLDQAASALTLLSEEREELREALKEMVYETTHLSPMEPDGGHRCWISGPTLKRARAALKDTCNPVDPTPGERGE